jgi:vancomycin resistance protein YoaR
MEVCVVIKIIWIAGLLFTQQLHVSESLAITRKGDTIATVQRSEYALPLAGTPIIDKEKYDQFVEELDQTLYKEPVNAVIDNYGNILPGQTGYRLYKQAFQETFYRYFFSGKAGKIEAPIMVLYPKVDGELLSHIRTKQIGQYVTYFNGYNEKRSHNITLAAEAINNHVVFPGETFSFNEVVGKRTEEKGYMRAPVIVRGELSEDVGGGICQVSSTLFNAIDNAGGKIVQRYSHSRSVPYVPPGRDATVSWYGPDFRFENNYNQPILIRAKSYAGRVVVTIHSSDMVEYTPRQIPRASRELPKEMIMDSDGNDIHTHLKKE